MRVLMAVCALVLTFGIYLVVAQFRASVHGSEGVVDANGNAVITDRA
jgi:hypothetical protein